MLDHPAYIPLAFPFLIVHAGRGVGSPLLHPAGIPPFRLCKQGAVLDHPSYIPLAYPFLGCTCWIISTAQGLMYHVSNTWYDPVVALYIQGVVMDHPFIPLAYPFWLYKSGTLLPLAYSF